MLERLSRNVGEKFWKGPDIVTAHDVTVYKHTIVPVIINPDSVPPLFGLPPEALSYAKTSVRSRYAQAGIDLHDDIGGQIGQWIVNNHKQTLDGGIHEQFETEAFVFNRCARPIFIPKGARLFRFFYEFSKPAARGRNLVSLVESGEIKIDGEYGSDWQWSYNRIGFGENNIIGIKLRIKPEGRKWIPPDPDDKPIIVDGEEEDYRKKIDILLVPVTQDKSEKLWIGETVPVSLGKSIEAILEKAVVKHPNEIDFGTMGLQTNSRLIDGGKTKWPIRVEVLSSTIPQFMPDFVQLHFVKSGN